MRLSRERLLELLDYDPVTGIFTRRVGRGGFRKGSVAGSTNQFYGYVHISVDQKMYKAHRLAFLAMGEELLDEEVDHVDGDRTNNSWTNLRKTSRIGNSRNCAIRSDNTSGEVGVGFHRKRRQWRARVGRKHIGWFSTFEEAVRARKLHPDNDLFSDSHGKRVSRFKNKFDREA